MLNNKGFALVEVLLVLALTALLLGLPSTNLSSFSASLEERLFFNELDAQISHIQTYAIVNNMRTHLEIEPYQKKITFYSGQNAGDSADKIIPFPEDMSVMTTQRSYSFSPGIGNISHINTVTFDSANTVTKYTFQLGSGRYKVAKTHK